MAQPYVTVPSCLMFKSDKTDIILSYEANTDRLVYEIV